MKEHNGLFLPDDEIHLIEWMERNGNHCRNGFQTYQYGKYNRALKRTDGRGRALDVGAHIGQWSRVMAMDFDEVIAFEPVPRFIECWNNNMRGVRNASLFERALGAEPATVGMITYTPGSNGDTRVADRASTGATKAEVVTLDSLDLSGVDFIKIDCEGYEADVVRGAAATIQRCSPTIIVEQKPGKAAAYGFSDTLAVDLLEGMGYVVRDRMAGDYILTMG